MVAILEKGEFNTDFHPMVDFIAASPLMYALTVKPTIFVSHIRQFWSTVRIESTDEGIHILATVDGIQRTVSESSLRRNTFDSFGPLQGSKQRMKEQRFSPLLMGEGSGTLTEPHHTPSPQASQSPHHDLSSSLHPTATTEPIPTTTPTEIPILRQYSRRATRITQSKALPTAADEPASLSRDDKLTDLCTRLQRQQTEMASKITAQDLEISTLKVRIKLFEDRDQRTAELSGDDASIKGRSLETGEEAGKEKMVESDTPKKKKIQEQIGVQMAREIEEQMAKEDQRMDEQIARDAEIARIHAEEELQMMIDGLDRSMTLEEIREKFILVWKQIEDFVPMVSKEEGERFKRKGLRLEQGSAKKMKKSEEVSKEDLKEMMQLVLVEEVYVEALQMLVKETLSIRQATSDKEKELLVELKRLFKPDHEDQLWSHTQALMHDPVEWRLYDTCGVHHVFTRDQEIFMLVERDYPLRRGLAIMMISNKLHVKNYSQMANDLILKIHKIANSLR
nr:hypothetical protein [Tanacetum cinerariifolium]